MGHYGLVLLFFWPVVSCLPLTDILYSGKLSREKTFMFLVAIRESFLHEIWGRGTFGTAKESNPRKFSPRKS